MKLTRASIVTLLVALVMCRVLPSLPQQLNATVDSTFTGSTSASLRVNNRHATGDGSLDFEQPQPNLPDSPTSVPKTSPQDQDPSGLRPDRDIAMHDPALIAENNTSLAVLSAHSTAGFVSAGSNGVFMSAGGDDPAFWTKHVCRGEKLTQAAIHHKSTAVDFVTGIDSQFDGTMEIDLKTWGYTDYKGKSMYCELDNIAATLNSIGVDAKFKKGSNSQGQNECFHVEHRQKSEAKPVEDQTYEVEGKTYRMTGAYSHVGVNARDGVVSFLNVKSAERGASKTWNVDKPADDDLPKLRQISDFAWGFWNRAHRDGTGLNYINKFLVHDVINLDTLRLIGLALKSYEVPTGQQRYTILPKWPGLEFDIETPEGKAMLGSPNGLAAGYFLVQHKTQLRGNKYVHKITVWKDSDGDEQMLFWVKDAPLRPEEEETWNPVGHDMATSSTIAKMVERSLDGKNLIRDHLVIAKL